MKVPAVLLLMGVLVGGGAGDLPPPERPYKILMLLPISSRSHRNVFVPIAEALADRGHKIVMLSNNAKASTHPNIYEVTHNLPDFREDQMNMFAERNNPAGGLQMFVKVLPGIAKKLYTVPVVQELYERRKDFDLVVIDHMFNEVAYPFAHEIPFITIATGGMDYRQSAVLGNVLNPAYVPNFISSFPFPMTMYQRFLNSFLQVQIAVYWRNWAVVPPIQKEISAQFPDLPPLLDIERNMSLALLNSHFSMDMTLPLLPSQVEVGGMHCRPAKPLPEDLESWINGAGPDGVIYFSLGSVARGDTMPKVYRDMFVEAFKHLKQRVIWKYEAELEGLSDNVLVNKWLPQQDILAHPYVKVFISHGGLLSMQEALYHATPLLTIPIYGDQPKNGQRVESDGLGLTLVWEKLTVDSIVKSLEEIINNPKYQKKTELISKSVKDQLSSPTDRAVFWTEYVIRHNGAPQLRSPAVQLSWVEYFMLDVLVVLLILLYVVIRVIRRIFQAITSRVFGKPQKKKKRE